jgi:hypothetical protein
MKILFIAAITLFVGSSIVFAGQKRSVASSVIWSCCKGATGDCSQGVDVTCDTSKLGSANCSAVDGSNGFATIKKTAGAGRVVAFDSGAVYSSCTAPNND